MLLTECWEDDVGGQRSVVGQNEDGKGRARNQEGSRGPGKVSNSLPCSDLAQVFQLLVVTDVVEFVHESGTPGV